MGSSTRTIEISTINKLRGWLGKYFYFLRDLIVNRRIHQVYLYALPVVIVMQIIAVHLFLKAPPQWVRITDAILR